jgi:hypothetical protein
VSNLYARFPKFPYKMAQHAQEQGGVGLLQLSGLDGECFRAANLHASI